MRMALTLNSESLSQDEARQLRQLVDDAGFFELPEEITSSIQGADRFLYRVTVEMEGQQHTVQTSDAATPATLQTMINWLTKAARKR